MKVLLLFSFLLSLHSLKHRLRSKAKNPNLSQQAAASEIALRLNQAPEHVFIPLIHKMMFYEHQQPYAMKSSYEYRKEYELQYLKDKLNREKYMSVLQKMNPLPPPNGLETKFLNLYPPAPLAFTAPEGGFGFKMNPLAATVVPLLTKFMGLFKGTPKPLIKDLAKPIEKKMGIDLHIPANATDMSWLDGQ